MCKASRELVHESSSVDVDMFQRTSKAFLLSYASPRSKKRETIGRILTYVR